MFNLVGLMVWIFGKIIDTFLGKKWQKKSLERRRILERSVKIKRKKKSLSFRDFLEKFGPSHPTLGTIAVERLCLLLFVSLYNFSDKCTVFFKRNVFVSSCHCLSGGKHCHCEWRFHFTMQRLTVCFLQADPSADWALQTLPEAGQAR